MKNLKIKVFKSTKGFLHMLQMKFININHLVEDISQMKLIKILERKISPLKEFLWC